MVLSICMRLLHHQHILFYILWMYAVGWLAASPPKGWEYHIWLGKMVASKEESGPLVKNYHGSVSFIHNLRLLFCIAQYHVQCLNRLLISTLTSKVSLWKLHWKKPNRRNSKTRSLGKLWGWEIGTIGRKERKRKLSQLHILHRTVE